MGKVFITGDTHGTLDIDSLLKFNHRRKLTKDDYVIIAGDVGILWSSFTPECTSISQRDLDMITLYNNMKFTTLFIDGNHENHNAFSKFQEEEWNGGKIHRISDSVIHLMRGQVYTIHGRKIFTMGGANSIDKEYRIEGISWWQNELPSYQEMNEAVENLIWHHKNVDYIVTHDCPTSCLEKILHFRVQKDFLNDFFEYLNHEIQFKHWYFGHHHLDKKIDDLHTVIYQKVKEI